VKKLDAGVAHRLQVVHEAASAKKALEPAALDVREVSAVTDVLYVCHAESGRAVRAISDAILEALDAQGIGTDHVEGKDALQWVLIDLGALMVHVFVRERRAYYNLEKLWHDARRVSLPP
jgi:ribosome-associated protein